MAEKIKAFFTEPSFSRKLKPCRRFNAREREDVAFERQVRDAELTRTLRNPLSEDEKTRSLFAHQLPEYVLGTSSPEPQGMETPRFPSEPEDLREIREDSGVVQSFVDLAEHTLYCLDGFHEMRGEHEKAACAAKLRRLAGRVGKLEGKLFLREVKAGKLRRPGIEKDALEEQHLAVQESLWSALRQNGFDGQVDRVAQFAFDAFKAHREELHSHPRTKEYIASLVENAPRR